MMAARREGGRWALELRDAATGQTRIEEARLLVNAAGPWVGMVLSARVGRHARARVRLVKGSHIVLPRLFAHERAYIFQNADQRVVFAIPYEADFTLIGTTDVEFAGDPAEVQIDQAEIDYLCGAVSSYLVRPVTPDQVVWTYSGVRPLYDDGEAAQSVTRDFVLELDAPPGEAPLLSVFGGKITTYRRLAEAALTKLGPWLGNAGPAWTRGATLPGGDFPADGLEELVHELGRECTFLPVPLIRRLARAYGTRSRDLLSGCHGIADLGVCFGANLYAREVEWLMAEEWARTAADVLWRRSKLGLRLAPSERDRLETWMANSLKAPVAPLPRQ
jgi:glycerol-3-phosphate dehydrogenase